MASSKASVASGGAPPGGSLILGRAHAQLRRSVTLRSGGRSACLVCLALAVPACFGRLDQESKDGAEPGGTGGTQAPATGGTSGLDLATGGTRPTTPPDSPSGVAACACAADDGFIELRRAGQTSLLTDAPQLLLQTPTGRCRPTTPSASRSSCESPFRVSGCSAAGCLLLQTASATGEAQLTWTSRDSANLLQIDGGQLSFDLEGEVVSGTFVFPSVSGEETAGSFRVCHAGSGTCPDPS